MGADMPHFEMRAGPVVLLDLSTTPVSHSGSNSIIISNVISQFSIMVCSGELEYHK